ncbi:MAG: hypothetical protein ACD_19C00415G0001 [uncultured bacterium]|nr:MAG: hypothetical protein ACD_19C00415G0001 [uncultured bacterium]
MSCPATKIKFSVSLLKILTSKKSSCFSNKSFIISALFLSSPLFFESIEILINE